MITDILKNAIEVIDILTNNKMPIGIRFKLLQNKRTLKESMDLLEETRVKTFMEYAIIENGQIKVDDNGKVCFETPEKELECAKTLVGLNKIEFNKDINIININDIESALEALDNNQLESIMFMLDEK